MNEQYGGQGVDGGGCAVFVLADFVLQKANDGLGGAVWGVENDDFRQPLQQAVVGFVGEMGAV